MKLLADISAVLSEAKDVFLYVLRGKPDDPKGYASDPVSFWHKPVPVANVEKKRKSNAVEVDFESNVMPELIALTNEERDKYFKENPNAKAITNSEAKKIVERRNAKEIQF